MLDRIERDIADGATRERGHLGYLHVFVDGQFTLEGEHRVPLDSFIGSDSDQLERVGAYETVPCDVLAREHRLEQKTVLRVVSDAEIGDDGRDEVCRKLDVHGHAVAALFVVDQAFKVVERGKGGQHLGVHHDDGSGHSSAVNE